MLIKWQFNSVFWRIIYRNSKLLVKKSWQNMMYLCWFVWIFFLSFFLHWSIHNIYLIIHYLQILPLIIIYFLHPFLLFLKKHSNPCYYPNISLVRCQGIEPCLMSLDPTTLSFEDSDHTNRWAAYFI